MTRLLILAAMAAALTLPRPAAAAPPTAAQLKAADLTHALMSPFCPGKLLAECTSPAAGELRQAILHRLEAGESADDLRADLVRRYGATILGAPEARGLGLLVWVLPALFGVAAAAGVGWKVARAASAGRAVATAPFALAGDVDAEALARLEDQLRDLD